MRSTCASPAAQAAWSLLAAYGAAPPKLRQEQLPKAVPQTCKVRFWRIFLGCSGYSGLLRILGDEHWMLGTFLNISKAHWKARKGMKQNICFLKCFFFHFS